MRKLFILLFSLACTVPALAGETLRAMVVKVVDGDTIKVELLGEMPELFRHQSVRLLGCDTPEKKDTRPEVAALAWEATKFTFERIVPGQELELRDVAFDKYGGRLLALVAVDGEDLCRSLIEAGLAKPYSGGKKEW
jgi:endonuclease YncB( thermonuclease family)